MTGGHLVKKKGIWKQEIVRERDERLTGEEVDLAAKGVWRDA